MRKILLYIVLILLSFIQVAGQDKGLRSQSVHMFIDCEDCDSDHIRREITWVNYVREPKESDIHVIITAQSTGAGGSKVSLFFIGQKKFKGQSDTLTYVNLPDDTDEIKRTRMVCHLKIGLIPYIKTTPLVEFLTIDMAMPEKDEEVADKWKNWIFSLSASGYINGDKNFHQFNIWSSVSANKVTEQFKTETSFSNSYSESNFDYEDYKYKSLNRSYSFSHRDVFSLTDHWSAGYWSGTNSSTYSNLKYSIYFLPAIEYSIFPYRESTRKQVRLNYSAGPSQRHYNEITIFNINEELVWKHNIDLAAEFVQKWGRLWLYTSYSNYLHDFSLNRLSFNTSLSLRLLRGLEFYLYAGYSIIHDQIGLPKGDATQEELLLQQRELKTDYSFWANAGLTYTFGNLYNNVVNPRFGN